VPEPGFRGGVGDGTLATSSPRLPEPAAVVGRRRGAVGLRPRMTDVQGSDEGSSAHSAED